MNRDLFSEGAQNYAKFRPMYPRELYDFIFWHVKSFENAWDAGTGNGQVARVLAQRFKKVYATDISATQIENAVRASNISYLISDENTPLAPQSIDLICTAQAIHWFDSEKFYNEVKRIGRPQAVLAVWGYGLLRISESINPLLDDFYFNIIAEYWNESRKLIDEEFKTISFPFDEIVAPKFFIRVEWTMDELEGYLKTWSSVLKYVKVHQHNPVDDLMKSIRKQWKKDKHEVRFPIFMRVGRLTNRLG